MSATDPVDLPDRLDVAVVGAGPGVAAAAAALRGVRSRPDEAGDLRWAVMSTDPSASEAVEASRHWARDVTTVFAMTDDVVLLLGQEQVRAGAVVVAVDDPPSEIRSEQEWRGRGVSYCAPCDGALARGRTVAAVLDSPALTSQLRHLSGSSHVHVFGDSAIATDVPSSPGVTLHTAWPVAIEGDTRVERVRLTDGTHLDVDQVFMLTNRIPGPVLVPGVAADGDRIRVDAHGRTNLSLVFALGAGTVTPAVSPADGQPDTGSARAHQVVACAIQSLNRAQASATVPPDPH